MRRKRPDVLKGVNLQIPKGKIFAIVGGNGTGKSTTLKSTCNICKPYGAGFNRREENRQIQVVRIVQGKSGYAAAGPSELVRKKDGERRS